MYIGIRLLTLPCGGRNHVKYTPLTPDIANSIGNDRVVHGCPGCPLTKDRRNKCKPMPAKMPWNEEDWGCQRDEGGYRGDIGGVYRGGGGMTADRV